MGGRSHTSKYMVELCGGKFDFGESFEEGGKREVMEETGVSIEAKDLEVISVTNDIVPTAHFITIGMLLKVYNGEPKVMEPDEITKWEWFPLDQLPSPIFPPSLKILKNYEEGKFYKH